MNKVTTLLGAMLIALVGVTSAQAQDVVSISAARDSVDGAMVTVKGIAITPSLESGSRTSFFIQQDGVGINIFDFGTPARIVEVGDSIMVTGEVDSFNNLKEIVVTDVNTDITIINSGNTVPEPRVVSYQEFIDFEPWLGEAAHSVWLSEGYMNYMMGKMPFAHMHSPFILDDDDDPTNDRVFDHILRFNFHDQVVMLKGLQKMWIQFKDAGKIMKIPFIFNYAPRDIAGC